jgi:hypothetical protein
MDGLIDDVRAQLRAVFSDRSVILAGGVVAGTRQPVDQLRALGAARFLVVSEGAGTGAGPDGPDVELLLHDGPIIADMVAGIRQEERTVAQPSEATLDGLRRFDPNGEAIVLLPPFLDARTLGDRAAFGARRTEWVALEDKTRADELFDAASVPRPPSVVVSADVSSISGAASELDRGAGTVWSGDAREGFNGGGAFVRWVRDHDDAHEAHALLSERCDRVRVASFVAGVPCSIHGFVLDDGVAAFRPVELVSLHAPAPPINPRFGAGLGYVDAVLPELAVMLLHYAAIEGRADVAHRELERVVVEAATRTRWGVLSKSVTQPIDETSTTELADDAGGFRRVGPGDRAAAVLSVGPARTGGHVRLELDAVTTPRGPSIAPLAAAALAFAEQEFALGLGPMSAPSQSPEWLS